MTLIERLTVLSNSGLPQDQLDTVMDAIRAIKAARSIQRDMQSDMRDAATPDPWKQAEQRLAAAGHVAQGQDK